ncbi:MAG: hypothetical protein EBU49_15025, partial [Proteobacteria bacterium]|nr:hypothetical protein [Pseudomonadota bacterium]
HQLTPVKAQPAFIRGSHGAPAVASPDESRLSLDWGELMHGRSVSVKLRPESPVDFEVLPERTSKLTAELRSDPELARFAVRRSLEKPVTFDQGVYGKLGTSTVYMAPLTRVGSSERLYWTMVRVLSEKYGCFIVEKSRNAGKFQFRCRDGRKIVMQSKIDSRFAHFWGRQYDSNGDEVVIKPGTTGKKYFAKMLAARRES